MSPELWTAVVGQTVIILVAVIGAAVRSERRTTRLEEKVEHIERIEVVRGEEHKELERQVQGISRAVARLEGAHTTCPYINPAASLSDKQA